MFFRRTSSRVIALLSATALAGFALSACTASDGGGTPAATAVPNAAISLMANGNDPISIATANGLVTAFNKAYPKIKVKVDSRPSGADGVNFVTTRLATGTMDDVFIYNSGSLLQGLQPDHTLQPLTDQPWVKTLNKNFKAAVSTSKALYGAPVGTSRYGGILYNKKVYATLGLKVPETWAAFISNSQKIKAAGIIPVLVANGDTWTSQMVLLANFANVAAQDPKWAAKYTANKAHFADAPAFAGFQHTADVFKLDLMNKDFASLTNVNALKLLATGEAAQYPMTTNQIGNLAQSNAEQIDDIGYFAAPADEGKSQATVWEAGGAYIPKTTTGGKLASAKKFLEFITSQAGCDAQSGAAMPGGPFQTSNCKFPTNAPAAVADGQKYEKEGRSGLALEFISPLVGPSLPQILVQVNSGISTAAEGAALYDQDVRKQALQLNLPGWK